MNLCFLHPHPGRWVFGFHKFCSHLLSSFLLHPPPRTFSHLSSYILCHTSRGLPSCILRQTYSLWHTLLHIFYHIFSLTYSVRHLLSDILYLASSVRISHLHFAFSFRICILHQTIHVSHFISLFRICLLHTESCRTATLSSWLQLPCKVLEADCLSFRTR